jgi:cytochrome c biogenesis protein
MSTAEHLVIKSQAENALRAGAVNSIASRALRFLCSVRLGVTLLILLGLACFIGMIVMQQNVNGFERYFAELTPSQRLVYGKLELFDIYHAWYFNALIAVLSLNIILSSLDRFPKTWKFASKPTVAVPLRWLREQSQTAELTFGITAPETQASVTNAIKQAGWRKIKTAEKNGTTFVMGQRGLWNRFGAYAVHVGLLTIFVGAFLTAQTGTTGQMPLAPGQSTDLIFETVVDLDKATQVTKRLPFKVEGVDIQQRLIKKEGSLSAMNTIDWITRFRITDETGTTEGSAQMNQPFDYRGYRFFQASFIPVGRARNVTLNVTPAAEGEIQQLTVPRRGSATLPDGTLVALSEFRGNFRIGNEDPNEDTSEYPNPAAILEVSRPGGLREAAYAFGAGMSRMPVASKAVGGYTFQLVDFEKVSDQHVLAVQRDPGAAVVYVGFVLLVLTLISVFFFSHQRVWAAITDQPGGTSVLFGGNTNRNSNAFQERFDKFIAAFAITSK